ncbi:MAG: hypothetical protein ABR508_10950, partial [Candidatus Baltobacteraceae bacterium]
FNRCYRTVRDHGRVTMSYAAQDAPPHGARFSKTIAMIRNGFCEKVFAAFPGGTDERARQLTSFAFPAGTMVFERSDAYALFEPRMNRVVMVAWEAPAVAQHRLEPHVGDALLALTFTRGVPAGVRFGFARATGAAQAQARLRAFANRRACAGEVAER